MPFLIDGHNVIAALRDIDLEDPDDEAKLVMKLRAWTARIRRKAIVIFDGGIPGGPSPTLSSADVKVIFAARYHTNADRIIGERLKQLPDPGNWTVVSSDREVLDDARMAGARVITATDFAESFEQSLVNEKEKPEAISSVEVETWLEIFQDSEEDHVEALPTPASAAPGTTPARGVRKPQGPRRTALPRPITATRTIAEQMDVELPPDPETVRPTGKPDFPTKAEVNAWLEVFHDDPNSNIPPPNLPKPKKVAPKRPVVNKTGDLSEAEVDTWLSVFGDEEDTKAASGAAAPPQNADAHRATSKLARHRENLAPADDQTEPQLSKDDLELWHRLFGDG